MLRFSAKVKGGRLIIESFYELVNFLRRIYRSLEYDIERLASRERCYVACCLIIALRSSLFYI